MLVASESSLAAATQLQQMQGEEPDADTLLERFLAYVSAQSLSLYPAQEEAILELLAAKNVILATPTGSGKSLVATAAHFFGLARGERSFYTSPVKALVSEKFFALCRDFGPDNVGMLTGDASVNHDAPIVCCTAEVLANMALRDGAHADVDHVIMDEFHYYADRERGGAWHIPLLTLPHARFLLMSATLGDTSPFEKHLTRLTKRETVSILSTTRPVPLDFEYKETPLHETIDELVQKGKAPIYLVNFTQRACAEEAQKLMSTDFCTKEEKKAIAQAIGGFRFDSPYGKTLQRFVRHGIGLHHAGLLPKYRLLVEKLAQTGHLKVICGTDTLGVGVNIPIRTVVLTQLCKFDGEKPTILSVRDFQQVSGRAGRRGFDTQGSVVAQAPEHVIENKRMVERASKSGQKKKVVKRSPPDKGYVPWDGATFDRLVRSSPEPLTPQLQLTHATLLNVLSRPQGGCRALVRLIADAHVSDGEKNRLRQTARELFRSLLEAGVLTIENGRPMVPAELQANFALDQSLSLYLIDTLQRLDPASVGYELDVLSLVESIVEDPDVILRRQLDKVRTERLAEMKAEGIEYEERMAELERLEYPKPNRDFIYATFNEYTQKNPWTKNQNIRPKGVAREMVEGFMSFADFTREYGLERSEGVLLRYLSDVYKVLVRTVPERARTEAVDEMIDYLGAIVRRVDSSLVSAWEDLKSAANEATQQDAALAIRDDRAEGKPWREREFRILLHNEVFRVVRALAAQQYDRAAEILTEARVAEPLEADAANSDPSVEASRPQTPLDETTSARWSARLLADAMQRFHESYAYLRLDNEARSSKHFRLSCEETLWTARQTLLSDEPTEWCLRFLVDIPASKRSDRPVFVLDALEESTSR